MYRLKCTCSRHCSVYILGPSKIPLMFNSKKYAIEYRKINNLNIFIEPVEIKI